MAGKSTLQLKICCNQFINTLLISTDVTENGTKFKNIRETYKISTFLLTLGLMYPNPVYDEKRKKLIVMAILSVLPAFTLAGNDIRLRILNNDMANVVRQSIILVSITFVIIKFIISIARKDELRSLLEEIDADYERFNGMSEQYQDLVEDTIRKTRKVEKSWCFVLLVTTASYPVLAGACTIYSQLFSDHPRRYMVHELKAILISEEQKYQSPYFEIVSLYTMYIVIFLFIGFTGFDGMFSVCLLHVSLKLKIYQENLRNLFNERDIQKIKYNIGLFVKNHCGVLRLIAKIQTCFEVWLVGIFINAVVQIGMAFTQITNQTESDINQMYYLYALATVVHIYLPCYFASDVTYNAAEIANVAYSSSWERVQDSKIRSSICFIIAKCQTPVRLTALDMLTFNMELFVSILQTSYSMFTLLRS
ncbi:odorant receptor 85c-like isoform X2 [Danaus plexippus]|uniref:odorant receptor 85c-like isoform X2 n=1 Tax=Danaus plexippus TaxID=13037 RepID=UPI002AB11332|nr:odorant receptor 85c-like isoform X2 [Danaus plexippus]